MQGFSIPRLAFDIDGVFANFVQGFLAIVNTKYGTSFSNDSWTEYMPAFTDPKFMNREQWDYGWAQLPFTEMFWAKLEAYPHIDFLQMNNDMLTGKYNGYFLTRRMNLAVGHPACCDANYLTRCWIENHGIRHATGVIATQGKERLAMLKAIAPDAYLDDWGEQFLEVRAAGINAFLIDRPYNQYIETEYRVASIGEFVARVTGRVVSFNPFHVNAPVLGEAANGKA